MWIFEQKHAYYGDKDNVWVMRDIRLVTWALVSDSLRARIEGRAMKLLKRPDIHKGDFRNAFLSGKDSIVASHVWDTSHLRHTDATNFEYHKLLSLREILLRNPTATLAALDREFEDILKSHEIDVGWISALTEYVADTTSENFWTMCEKIRHWMWYTGFIFFLEWCIERGVCISETISLATEECNKLSLDKNNSFFYWDFRNIIRLAETRQKLLNQEKGKQDKAFVISWWAWNTLASLWTIKAHLENWGKIRAISWTSMWGMVAALVWAIWNDIALLSQLIDDITNGFPLDSKKYQIPKWDLYLPWNARKAKGYIEALLRKYGIHRDTKFSELKIPVVINAGRQYKKWEQEILLGGSDSIHDAVLASMNIPIPFTQNYWGIWSTKIDGVAMIDYAANERGNPNHWIETLGIDTNDEIIVDAGYSSEAWNEEYPTKTRQNFIRATQRDFFAKLKTRRKWWIVIDIDPGLASQKTSWGIVYPKKIKKLIDQWYTKYKEAVLSTSQSLQ